MSTESAPPAVPAAPESLAPSDGAGGVATAADSVVGSAVDSPAEDGDAEASGPADGESATSEAESSDVADGDSSGVVDGVDSVVSDAVVVVSATAGVGSASTEFDGVPQPDSNSSDMAAVAAVVCVFHPQMFMMKH